MTDPTFEKAKPNGASMTKQSNMTKSTFYVLANPEHDLWHFMWHEDDLMMPDGCNVAHKIVAGSAEEAEFFKGKYPYLPKCEPVAVRIVPEDEYLDLRNDVEAYESLSRALAQEVQALQAKLDELMPEHTVRFNDSCYRLKAPTYDEAWNTLWEFHNAAGIKALNEQFQVVAVD